MSSTSAEEAPPAAAPASQGESSVPVPAGGQAAAGGVDKVMATDGAGDANKDGNTGDPEITPVGVVHVLPDDVLGGRSGGASSYRAFVGHPLLEGTANIRRDVWHKEVQRGCLTTLDKSRLMAADLVTQPRDGSLTGEGAAWYARIQELPAAVPLELPKKDFQVSASILRWPEEMSYLRRALAVWDGPLKIERGELAIPGPRYVALQPPFLLRSYSRAHSQRVQSERRARIKRMVISHNHQEFWKQDEAARARYYPRVMPDTYRLKPPKGFAPAGVPFAWYFLDVLLQASGQSRWDSIPYGMLRSEQAVMAAACWYQECRNRAVFWVLPEMLVIQLRDQLTTSFLETGFKEGKAFLDDIIRFRLLMPALDGSFQRDVRAQKPERGDGGGWVSVQFHSLPPYDIQLQTSLPRYPQLGGMPAPAPAPIPTAAAVAQTGWGRLFASGGPAGRPAPPSPPARVAPFSQVVVPAPVLQAPPAPRAAPAPPVITSPVRGLASPATPARPGGNLALPAPVPLTVAGETPISGAGASSGHRPVMVSDAPLVLSESTRRLARFRVDDWYLGQSSLSCGRWNEDLVELQLLRRKTSIRGTNITVVLAAYAQLLKNVVDQVFDWVEKGPSAGVSDLNQMMESLTRRQLGDRWEEIFLDFQRQGAEYRRQQESRWGSGSVAVDTAGYDGAATGSGTIVEGGYVSRTPAGATAAQRGYQETTQDRDRSQRDGWPDQDQGGRGYAPGTGQDYGYSSGAGAGQGYQYVPSSRGYSYGVGDRRPAERGAEDEPGAQRQRQ